MRAHGRAALETQLAQAIDLFDRQVQILERRGWFADLRHRRRAIDSLLPTIRAARDPLTRDLYLARLADVSQLDKATLVGEADEPPATGRGMAVRRHVDGEPPAPPAPEDGPPPEDPPPAFTPAPYVKRPWTGRRGKPAPPEWQATAVPPRARKDEPVERALIRAMLVDRDLVERLAERHAPSDFREPNYGAIFGALLEGGHADPLDAVAARLPASAVAVLQELTDSGDAHPPEASDVSLSVARFDARRLEARIEEILRIMPTVSPAEQDVLMRERLDLESKWRRLLPIRSPRGKRKG